MKGETLFAQAYVDGGTVAWPGEFDLAPERLYALTHVQPLPKMEGWGHFTLWHCGNWLLTWHAPWCRRCEHPTAGRGFKRLPGYIAGLGFELSYPTRQ